jgi:hypothetical protein
VKSLGSDDTKGSTVYPDIIIHHRGTNDNYVVLEAKKISSTLTHESGNSCPCDECKLRLYKSELGYHHAFFVKFPIEEKLKKFSDGNIAEYIKEIN